MNYHATASAKRQHEHITAHHEDICVHNIAADPEVVLQPLPSCLRTEVVDKQSSANNSNTRPGCRAPSGGTSSICPEGVGAAAGGACQLKVFSVFTQENLTPTQLQSSIWAYRRHAYSLAVHFFFTCKPL